MSQRPLGEDELGAYWDRHLVPMFVADAAAGAAHREQFIREARLDPALMREVADSQMATVLVDAGELSAAEDFARSCGSVNWDEQECLDCECCTRDQCNKKTCSGRCPCTSD